MQTVYTIRVKGTDTYIDISTDKIPDNSMAIIVKAGLDAVIGGRGRTKLGKVSSFASPEEYAKAAVEIFMKQLEDAYEGKTKAGPGGKAVKKAQDAIAKEMKRIVRIDVESFLSANGYKVSKVSAKDKDRIGEALINRDPEKYRKAAEASLAAAATGATTIEIDLGFLGDEAKKTPRKKGHPADTKAKAKPTVVPPPTKAKPSAHLRQ